MAKYEEITKPVEDLFYEVLDTTSINNWVEFKVLANNKQKELFKVVKANDLVQLLADVNIAVVINEEIFNQLPPDMQRIAIDEAIAGIYVTESDSVQLDKPDFNTYTGVLAKYGDSEIIKLHESVKSLYSKKEQEEEEAKAARKAKREAARKTKNS
jgi:hypothetical protein